jgi:hypothetical protein
MFGPNIKMSFRDLNTTNFLRIRNTKKNDNLQNVRIFFFGAGVLNKTQEHGIKESGEEDASKDIICHGVCVILVFVCEVRRDS